MTFKVKGLKDENARKYEGLNYNLIAHKHSCQFCKHLSDVFYDFTHGPYMFFCDYHIIADAGVFLDGCLKFEENKEAEE